MKAAVLYLAAFVFIFLAFVEIQSKKVSNVVSQFLMNITEANNFGAIKYSSSNDWLGQVGATHQGFAVFASREYGIRACLKLLRNYFAAGRTSVRSIISAWSATDQEAYISFVSDWLGVLPDNELDARCIPNLAQSIMRYETGSQLVPMDYITEIQNKYAV